MAVDITSVVLVSLQIIIQIAAVYFTYIVYKYDRLHKIWLAVTVALALMTVRRFISLAIESDILVESETVQFIDRSLIPVAVSALLLGGLWGLKRSFERFDIIEHRTREKIQKLVKKKK